MYIHVFDEFTAIGKVKPDDPIHARGGDCGDCGFLLRSPDCEVRGEQANVK